MEKQMHATHNHVHIHTHTYILFSVFIIVFLLTLCGWVPGVIAALVILNNPDN